MSFQHTMISLVFMKMPKGQELFLKCSRVKWRSGIGMEDGAGFPLLELLKYYFKILKINIYYIY